MNIVSKWLLDGGVRSTKQRVALATMLIGDGCHRHVTAESLHMKSQNNEDQVSLATVYNTLRLFCDAGLIREIVVDANKSYFDTCTTDHPHFFWEDECKLTDAPIEELKIEQLPTAPAGTVISKVDVIVRIKYIAKH